MGRVLAFRKDIFWLFDTMDGSFHRLGELFWYDVTGVASLPDRAFVVEKQSLYEIELSTGRIRQMGRRYEWPSVTFMCGAGDWLYLVNDNDLWKVSPEDGSFEHIGKQYDWPGNIVFAGSDTELLFLYNEQLFRVDPNTGAWEKLSRPFAWYQATGLCSHNGHYYAVRRQTLWEIRAEDGLSRQVGDRTWHGDVKMAANDDGIIILHRDNLFRTNPETGGWVALSDDREWNAVHHLVAL